VNAVFLSNEYAGRASKSGEEKGEHMEKQKRVILFTTPTCSFCKTAKRYLQEKRVKFREIDVSRDENAARDMQRRTGQQGVPLLLIDNRPIVGFDKDKINRYLEIN
jgi:glutaredoxin 3